MENMKNMKEIKQHTFVFLSFCNLDAMQQFRYECVCMCVCVMKVCVERERAPCLTFPISVSPSASLMKTSLLSPSS